MKRYGYNTQKSLYQNKNLHKLYKKNIFSENGLTFDFEVV